jgi:hypothetical protein
MSEITTPVEEITTENASESPSETPADNLKLLKPIPLRKIFSGECPSVSGRSILTYAVGRHQDTGELHLRIVDNSGKGMWFNWLGCGQGDRCHCQRTATELTAKSFHALHPGKSINTGGFVMAVLKDLGLIRANEENGRIHEHVPATTFEKVAMVRMGQTIEATAPVTKPAKRKGKGA